MDTEAKIEILPKSPGESVLETLNDLISKSKEIYAAISYWTIDHRILDENFIKSIGKPGFLCVDIHYPTNIDVLLRMAEAGANLFLHLYKIEGLKEIEGIGEDKLPKNLMHSKTFYFLMDHEKVTIWIGSHNATNSALQGVNIETAVIISTSKSDIFAQDVLRFLEGIKSKCTLFEKENLEYYKWLQSSDKQGFNDHLIQLYDPNSIIINKLEREIKGLLLLLLLPKSPIEKLKKVDSMIFILISKQDSYHLYEAKIYSSGNLDDRDKDQKFSNEYYAFSEKSEIPEITKQDNSNFKNMINPKKSIYYVIFELQDKLPGSIDVQGIQDKWQETNKKYTVTTITSETTEEHTNPKPLMLTTIKRHISMEFYLLLKEPVSFKIYKDKNIQIKSLDEKLIIQINLTRDAEGYFNRGIDRYKSGDWEGAVADFDQLIKLKKENYTAEAYHYRGLAKFTTADKEQAKSDFEQAVKIHNDRGLEQYKLKDYERAIEHFNQAIELQDHYAEASFNRDVAASELAQKEKVIQDFNNAIKSNHDFATVYNNRGVAKYELGELGKKEEAIDDFTKAIELNPSFAEAYFNRGVAKYKSGKKEEAIDDFTKAIELNPDFADAYLET